MSRATLNTKYALLIFALLITALILYLNPIGFLSEEKNFRAYGYGAAFLIMLLSNATVILPVPGLFGVFVLGRYLDPLILGVVAGTGAALGELSGYIFGYGGSALLEDRKLKTYERVKKWMERNGFLTVFVFALIPNPLFDLAGIAAGALEYRWWKFLLAAALGKILQSIALAYLGSATVFVF
ncbi:MAG: VTT domain-containing protein [Candidatus Micrarchaeota archaeon]